MVCKDRLRTQRPRDTQGDATLLRSEGGRWGLFCHLALFSTVLWSAQNIQQAHRGHREDKKAG